MNSLRIGLVGYGGAGRGIHSRLIAAAGYEVTVVVTRSSERAEQARADWPGLRVVDDLDQLLDLRDDYDLVVLASPSGVHEEQATLVLTEGVPLLLDKPIALDGAGAGRLLEVARMTRTPFTVFQNRRWDPEQLTLRAVIASGGIGRVHRFERRWERWRPVPQHRWKEQDTHGGGLLLDLGTHLVDSAIQLFGPVASVHAEMRALTTPTEDDVFLALEHVADADTHPVISHLGAGSLVGAPGPRTRVLGTGGAFVVTGFEGEPSPFQEMDADAPTSTLGWLSHGGERRPVPRAPGGHEDIYPAVAAWLRDGGPIPVDPQDAVRTAQVLDAARLSAVTGRRVDL